MTRTLIIAGRIPSKKNNKRAFGGKVVASEAYLEWEKEQVRTLMSERLAPIEWKRVECSAFFWFPDNRVSDMSNKWESIADMLVTAGFLKDDCWQQLSPIHFYPCGVDKNNPRVLLRFSDSTGRDYTPCLSIEELISA